MQNLEILGIVGRGLIFFIESTIFGIADPGMPIHYETFMGLQ